MLLAHTEIEVEVDVDSNRLRTADIPYLVGNYAKFSETTGWQPDIPLAQTLGDLLDWWREELSNRSQPPTQ
jgi:GDP-4-dehydro-6-deoxy-D-mannose reductase